jgi:hypothetical protein
VVRPGAKSPDFTPHHTKGTNAMNILGKYANMVDMQPSGLAYQIRHFLESCETHTIAGVVPNAPKKMKTDNARKVIMAAHFNNDEERLYKAVDDHFAPSLKPIWSN